MFEEDADAKRGCHNERLMAPDKVYLSTRRYAESDQLIGVDAIGTGTVFTALGY